MLNINVDETKPAQANSFKSQEEEDDYANRYGPSASDGAEWRPRTSEEFDRRHRIPTRRSSFVVVSYTCNPWVVIVVVEVKS